MVGNPALTDLGRRQSRQLAEREWPHIDEVWVSELTRAVETAAPLATKLALTPRVHPWMNEIGDPVEWDGMPIGQVDARVARLERAPSLERLWKGVRRGEPYHGFRERVTSGLLKTLACHGVTMASPDQPRLWGGGERKSIVLVAHGGTNAVIYETLLGCGATPIAWHKFRSLHTGVAVLRTYPMAHARVFAMESFGDVAHLSPHQVTA